MCDASRWSSLLFYSKSTHCSVTASVLATKALIRGFFQHNSSWCQSQRIFLIIRWFPIMQCFSVIVKKSFRKLPAVFALTKEKSEQSKQWGCNGCLSHEKLFLLILSLSFTPLRSFTYCCFMEFFTRNHLPPHHRFLRSFSPLASFGRDICPFCVLFFCGTKRSQLKAECNPDSHRHPPPLTPVHRQETHTPVCHASLKWQLLNILHTTEINICGLNMNIINVMFKRCVCVCVCLNAANI